MPPIGDGEFLWRFPFCPEPPDWRLDWDAIEATFAEIRDLAGCLQSPVHHAEGDVLIHTRMVCHAVAELPTWRTLPAKERSIVFAATLLHDIGKPFCTKDENGRITSRGHALNGAHMARCLLWRLWPEVSSIEFFQMREAVVALVRHHGLPLYFLDRPDPRRAVIEASMTARLDLVAILAEADVRGRVCSDQHALADRVSLFRDFASESRCLSDPHPFASNHSRFAYFRKPDLPPDNDLFDDTWGEVVLMSGLPASGKDTWIREHAGGRPVISLDELREELDVSPDDNQGALANEARERARSLLRRQQPFVWNATNTSRPLRQQLVGLFADYRARIRIVATETSPAELARRNRRRSDPVPKAVIDRLRSRLDVPDATEAHLVDIVVN